MGEKQRKPFQLTFNGLLKVDFHGSRVTSDGGLILVRELMCRAGSVARTRINSFWLPKTLSQGAVSAGAPFCPLSQRL